MADFHKYTFYYSGNEDYAAGWDRIFGKKEGQNGQGSKLQEQSGVQKVARLRANAQGLPRKNARKDKRQGSPRQTLPKEIEHGLRPH